MMKRIIHYGNSCALMCANCSDKHAHVLSGSWPLSSAKRRDNQRALRLLAASPLVSLHEKNDGITHDGTAAASRATSHSLLAIDTSHRIHVHEAHFEA
jgi:hypothetical protein